MAIDRHDPLCDRRTLLDVYRCNYLSEGVPSRLWRMGPESRRLWIAVRPAIRTEAKPPGRRDRRSTRTGESGTHSEVFQKPPRDIIGDKSAFNPIGTGMAFGS